MSLEVNIRKRFKDFNLDVAIEAGSETLGFLGASGCGKSLTMRCVAGIETPDEGHIVVNGKVFFDSKKKINLKPQERKTALLFQNYMLFPNHTVEQNVAAGIPKNVSRAEALQIVEETLARFSLTGFNKRYPAQLSGGQQQRVALARMLAAKPGILMLDEPFSALDSYLKGVLEQNLVDLFDAFEGTILYVSHDIDEAVRFCDRIAVIEAGHIVEIDSSERVVNYPESEAALKLSGCKNVVKAEKVGQREVFIPNWGINVETIIDVADDIKYLGVRAFYLQRADGPGKNCYRVRVDRISDSRFDRSVLLRFLDRQDVGVEVVDRSMSEMTFLHQHLFWRVDKLMVAQDKLPEIGDELWICIPEDKIYLVSK